jgi:hypothetical protein
MANGSANFPYDRFEKLLTREVATNFAPGDVTPAADTITITGHVLNTTQRVVFSTDSGDQPAGLSIGLPYYVIWVDVNTIKLAASIENARNGVAVDILDAGTGVHTLTYLSEAMEGNHSSADAVFTYTNDTSCRLQWTRTNWEFICGSPARPDRWGISVLVKGILYEVVNADGSLAFDLLNGRPLRSTTELGRKAGIDVSTETVAGISGIQIRHTLEKAGSKLYLEPGQSIRVVLRDDISAASAFMVEVQMEKTRTSTHNSRAA